MKLRFKVDQGEAMRQGVDAPTSVVTTEVNPKTLTQEQRNLLADRMDGIDIFKLSPDHTAQPLGSKALRTTSHITAKMATFEALMEAVRADEAEVRLKLGNPSVSPEKPQKANQIASTAKGSKTPSPRSVNSPKPGKTPNQTLNEEA